MPFASPPAVAVRSQVPLLQVDYKACMPACCLRCSSVACALPGAARAEKAVSASVKEGTRGGDCETRWF